MDCTKCVDKPCCKNIIMPVEVTIDFIFRLANHFGLKPEDSFDKYCDMAPILQDSPYGNVSGIALKYPCPFFSNGCIIHDIKPNTCLFFPATPYSQNLSESYYDHPCLNGEMSPPDQNEINFAMELVGSYIENNGLELNRRILFKNRQPFIDIRDLREKYNEVEKYLNSGEKQILEITREYLQDSEKETEVIIDILKKEFESKLKKKTILFRIRRVDSKHKNTINKLNRAYFEIRRKFDK